MFVGKFPSDLKVPFLRLHASIEFFHKGTNSELLYYKFGINTGMVVDSATPQIYTRDPKPPIPPRVMPLSAQFGVFWFLADHTLHKCVHDLCVPNFRAAFETYFIFTLRLQYIDITYTLYKPQLF